MTDKIIDRIRKLLALKTSSNVHEASQAAALASELMAQHRLSEAQVQIQEGRTEDQPIEREYYKDGERRASEWRIQLMSAIVRDNCSRMIISGPAFQLIGTTDDLNAAKYMYTYLRQEIERLADNAEVPEFENGKRYKNAFKLGAVSEIRERLTQARKERADALRTAAGFADLAQIPNMGPSTAALAIIDRRTERAQARVDEILGPRGGRTHQYHGARSQDGYSAGRQAGAGISLGSNRRGIGAPAKRIGA